MRKTIPKINEMKKEIFSPKKEKYFYGENLSPRNAGCVKTIIYAVIFDFWPVAAGDAYSTSMTGPKCSDVFKPAQQGGGLYGNFCDAINPDTGENACPCVDP